MSIDKDLWLNSYFTNESCSKWKCPTCGTGLLTVKKDDVHSSETTESKKMHDDPDWEAYWIGYRVSATLRCDNSKCNDITIVTGKGGVEEEYVETENDWYSQYYDSFRPEYFIPNLKIFDIEKSCPQTIQNEIEKSFALFFLDIHSCANRIRSSIELLMDEFKIPKSKIAKSKRIGISLHTRIIKFGVKYPEVTNSLLAIKWIGNAGSHTSKTSIERKDIMDAYEILEHSLSEIFNNRTKEIEKIVKEINKKKAPRSKGNNSK